jgi:hypothetical protein
MKGITVLQNLKYSVRKEGVVAGEGVAEFLTKVRV